MAFGRPGKGAAFLYLGTALGGIAVVLCAEPPWARLLGAIVMSYSLFCLLITGAFQELLPVVPVVPKRVPDSVGRISRPGGSSDDLPIQAASATHLSLKDILHHLAVTFGWDIIIVRRAESRDRLERVEVWVSSEAAVVAGEGEEDAYPTILKLDELAIPSHVFLTRAPYVVLDLAASTLRPGIHDPHLQRLMKCAVCLPICYKQTVVGTIECYRSVPGDQDFLDEYVTFLSGACPVISLLLTGKSGDLLQ